MNHSPTIELARRRSARRSALSIGEQPSGTGYAAQQRLKSSKYSEVRLVQCDFCEGMLVLYGCVSSFYLKQLAQEAVRSLSGIKQHPQLYRSGVSRSGSASKQSRLRTVITNGSERRDGLGIQMRVRGRYRLLWILGDEPVSLRAKLGKASAESHLNRNKLVKGVNVGIWIDHEYALAVLARSCPSIAEKGTVLCLRVG